MIAKWTKSWNVSERFCRSSHFFLRRDRVFSFEIPRRHHPIAVQLFLFQDWSTSEDRTSILKISKTHNEFPLEITNAKLETPLLWVTVECPKRVQYRNKNIWAAMSTIPTQISIRFFLTALSKEGFIPQILLGKREEKVFGKSAIRQNCLTRRHFLAFRSI